MAPITLIALVGAGTIAAAGLVCNLLLLYVLWTIGELWQTFTFRLISLVALGDIGTSLTILATGIFRALLGTHAQHSPWYCRVFGASLLFSHVTAGLIVSIIALDRYLAVCHHRRLHPRHTWLVLGGIALLLGTVLLTNSYHNAFRMDTTDSICVPFGSGLLAVAGVVSTFLFSVPLVILSFCYVAIFFVLLRAQRRHRELANRNLPLRALLWFGAYLLCYAPRFYATLRTCLAGAENSPALCVGILLGLSSIIVINPVLVLFLNQRVRLGAKATFLPSPLEDVPSKVFII